MHGISAVAVVNHILLSIRFGNISEDGLHRSKEIIAECHLTELGGMLGVGFEVLLDEFLGAAIIGDNAIILSEGDVRFFGKEIVQEFQSPSFVSGVLVDSDAI